jgi:hypothetical protein
VTSMRAGDYAPIVPLDTEPLGPLTDMEQRREALMDALRKVELGRYDEKFIDWLLTRLDNSAMRGLVSLVERARRAGMVDLLDIESARLRSRPRPEVPGNSGPGF